MVKPAGLLRVACRVLRVACCVLRVACCVLRVACVQETSRGQFAAQCVSTTARIITDASSCMDIRSNYSFVRNFTPKPLPTIEVRRGC
jgi:hypothetical protein